MSAGARLLRQASPLVVGRLASAALTFALPLGLARLLDPAGFGTYKQVFLVAQTVLLIGQLGLTQSLYYFLPGGDRRRGAYLAQALVGLAVLALVAGTLLWMGVPELGAHLGDGRLGALRTPIALLAAGMLLAAPLEAALTSEGRVGGAAICYVLSDGARAALLLVGALRGGVAGLAWAGAIYAGVRVAALALLLVGGVLPLGRPSRELARRQLDYALPFAGAMLLYVAQKQFAAYAVSARWGAATYALFAVASFHLPVVDILYTPITEVLMVRLGQRRQAGGPAAGLRREWDDAVERLASLLFPATIGAWLLGPRLLPLLFTHRYDASVGLFLLASLEVPLWILPVDALLRAAGETRFLFGWNAARALLTAGLVLAGMRLLGVAGAVAGGVVSEAISRGVMLERGRRHLDIGFIGALDPARLGGILVAATVAALPAWLALRALPGRSGLVFSALLYGFVYLSIHLAIHLAHVAWSRHAGHTTVEKTLETATPTPTA